MTRSELEVYQAERLRGLVKELVGRNPFWTQKLQAAGLSPRDLQHPSDLCKLPFTTKQELVEDQHRLPPYGSNLTYPLPAYSRLHQTSGTKGRPMRWLDTIASWDWFMTCWRHIYRLVGVTREDVVGFPFSFGPFIGFWAAFDGAQRLGNRSLPLGGLSSEARLQFLVEHGS